MKKEFDTGLKDILKNTYGVDSLKEAVQKAKLNNPVLNEIAAQVNGDAEAMRKAIKEVEEELKSVDIDKIDQGTVVRLSKMPLNDLIQVKAWRDEWIRIIRGDW